MKNIKMISLAIVAVAAMAFTKLQLAKTYSVSAKETSAKWTGKKVTGQHNGDIMISKGNIETNGNMITGGTIEFDMNSMTCSDLTDKSWNDKLIGHLKSEDFFGTEKYPTALFVMTSVKPKSDNEYDVTGNLTVKGKTEEVTFPAMIKMDDKTMVTIATIKVDRTKYGIRYGSKSFVENIGDKAIDDEFLLEVNVVAKAD